MSPPPSEKALISWAKALKVKKEQIRKFIDEANVAQGIIPGDILNKEEMIEFMPALFRTIRNKKPSKEEIDRLINLIKNA